MHTVYRGHDSDINMHGNSGSRLRQLRFGHIQNQLRHQRLLRLHGLLGGPGRDLSLHGNSESSVQQLRCREHLQNRRRQQRLFYVHGVWCSRARDIGLHDNARHGLRRQDLHKQRRLRHRLPVLK